MLSREALFLLNNLLLTVFMFTVLIGTLFPLVAEAIRGVKVSVFFPEKSMLPDFAVIPAWLVVNDAPAEVT